MSEYIFDDIFDITQSEHIIENFECTFDSMRACFIFYAMKGGFCLGDENVDKGGDSCRKGGRELYVL